MRARWESDRRTRTLKLLTTKGGCSSSPDVGGRGVRQSNSEKKNVGKRREVGHEIKQKSSGKAPDASTLLSLKIREAAAEASPDH